MSKRDASDQNVVDVIKKLPNLEDVLNGQRKPIQVSLAPEALNNLVVRIAALATIAMQSQDSALALRLWRLERDLQDFAGETMPLNTHASRNVAMHLLMQASEATDRVILPPPAWLAPADPPKTTFREGCTVPPRWRSARSLRNFDVFARYHGDFSPSPLFLKRGEGSIVKDVDKDEAIAACSRAWASQLQFIASDKRRKKAHPESDDEQSTKPADRDGWDRSKPGCHHP